MPNRVQIAGCDVEAEIVARRPHLLVRLADVVHVVASGTGGAGGAGRTGGAGAGVGADAGVGVEFELSIDGVTYRGWRCTVGNEVHVRLNSRTFIAHFDNRGLPTDSVSAQQEIRADMPGVVVAVHCEPGRAVKAGDKLLTTESMKLQATLVASRDALVDQIHVTPAMVFERGALLVSFTRSESGSP